jgi:hypothetical protein
MRELRLDPRLMRTFHRYFLSETEIAATSSGPCLDAEATGVLRTTLLGAARAAERTLVGGENGGGGGAGGDGEGRKGGEDARSDPVRLVDRDTAVAAFEDALAAEPVSLEDLQDSFRPTAILYQAGRFETDADLLTFHDTAPPHDVLKGLSVGRDTWEDRERRVWVYGDTLLVPPATRGWGRRRQEWIQQSQLEPPPITEHAGAFWRLGGSRLFYLQILSAHERLVLAALVGTNRRECVLVAPQPLFPKVGFVVEVAREMGRTIFCVPLDCVPARLLERLQEKRSRPAPGGPFMAAEEGE